MLFKDIPGLEEVKQSLIQAVQKGQIAHAQLFFGNEGSANLSLALAYATYINCENRQPDDACGQCAACSKINKYIHPDVHFVFPVPQGLPRLFNAMNHDGPRRESDTGKVK